MIREHDKASHNMLIHHMSSDERHMHMIYTSHVIRLMSTPPDTIHGDASIAPDSYIHLQPCHVIPHGAMSTPHAPRALPIRDCLDQMPPYRSILVTISHHLSRAIHNHTDEMHLAEEE